MEHIESDTRWKPQVGFQNNMGWYEWRGVMAKIDMKNSYYFIKLNDLVLASGVTFSSPTTRPSGVPVCDTSITKSAASDIYFALYNPLALIDPNIIKLNVGTETGAIQHLVARGKIAFPQLL